MAEFKGTKGKWSYRYVSGFIKIISENHYDIMDAPNEKEANALLISKAPEMLEMLNFIVENVDISMYAQEKIEQLIKEATEIQSNNN